MSQGFFTLAVSIKIDGHCILDRAQRRAKAGVQWQELIVPISTLQQRGTSLLSHFFGRREGQTAIPQQPMGNPRSDVHSWITATPYAEQAAVVLEGGQPSQAGLNALVVGT
jgi:hypothetical protein